MVKKLFQIKELITERQKYALGNKNNPWRDDLLAKVISEAAEDEIAFITVGSTLYEPRKIKAIQKNYYITGAYKLGNIFMDTNLPFYIVHLSKTASPEFKVSWFNDTCYSSRTQTVKMLDHLIVPDHYTKNWETYIANLEKWMNGGELPESNEQYEFSNVPMSYLYNGSYLPDNYTKEQVELRQLMDHQATKKLSELVQILFPEKNNDGSASVKVLRTQNLNYPLDIKEIKFDLPTSVVLQKGDIVIPKTTATKLKAYLYNYSGKEKIYASEHLVVIRCIDFRGRTIISPEYLFLYLNSNTALKAINAHHVGIAVKTISSKDIVNLPIAIPTLASQKYETDFIVLTNENVRNYITAAKVTEDKKPEIIEDILNIEIANNIKAYKEEQLRKFLNDDLKELNTCFRGKAYKATLILAGSILEAVLIDWLSEINHKNYFNEDYYVKDRNGYVKRADLIDYIDAIKYIQRPQWMDEANKAHEIRKKRNLVHAKLCLKSDDINEKVCREVIAYLSDVLKTRGIITK